MIRVSTYTIRNNMPKIEGKHLMFKPSINGMKTCLLVDNSSEIKLIDKFFVRTNKISTFKLKKAIKLTLGNGEVVQTLTRGCLVDVEIGDHKEQILCYLAKLDVYTVILGDGWLQTHNPAIDWKKQTVKFNSDDCLKRECLLYGIPCIEYAIGSKIKHQIGIEKPTTMGDIDIWSVNAKYFFWIAQQKDCEGYLWIPQVRTENCIKKCCAGVISSMRK